MKGSQSHLNPKYISLIEVEIRIEVTIVAGLEIMHIEDAHHTIKILEVEIEVILVTKEIMGTMHEVVRDVEIIIMTIGETAIEVKAMIGIGVGH